MEAHGCWGSWDPKLLSSWLQSKHMKSQTYYKQLSADFIEIGCIVYIHHKSHYFNFSPMILIPKSPLKMYTFVTTFLGPNPNWMLSNWRAAWQCVCTCIHVRVLVAIRSRLSASPPYFWNRIFNWIWRFSIWLGWLTYAVGICLFQVLFLQDCDYIVHL